MDRYLSPIFYRANLASQEGATVRSHSLQTAPEAGFKEGWLRAAIAADPEIVIGACAEAELTEDETWYLWSTNVTIGTGAIDVLLLSESGRVGIVETKLSYNPENRRTVLAQVMDYAIALPELDMLRLPAIPLVGGVPVVDPEMLHDRIREGDYLLIIAGDRLHTRVVQLSKSLLGRHLVRGWDLALVEVAVYVQANPQGIPEVLLVPYLRGAVIADVRQVVKVIVSGDRARIDVEDASSVQIEPPRHNWNEAAAFAEFERADVSSAVRDFAHALRRLRTQYPSVSIDTGSGQFAKLILKRNGKSLLELSANGYIAFRPYKFPEALGTDLAITYQQALNELLGGQVKGTHPVIRLQPPTTDALVHGILQVIENTVERANT